MKDLRTRKGHEENGSSRCSALMVKKPSPGWISWSCVCPAVCCQAHSCSAWLLEAAPAMGWCGLWSMAGRRSIRWVPAAPAEPGAVCQDGPWAMLQVTANLLLLCIFPHSCSLWQQACGHWTASFDGLWCWMVPRGSIHVLDASIRVSGYFEMTAWS